MSDKKDFELNEKELDAVAGGYQTCKKGGRNGYVLACGYSKSGQPIQKVFTGRKREKRAEEWIKENLDRSKNADWETILD